LEKLEIHSHIWHEIEEKSKTFFNVLLHTGIAFLSRKFNAKHVARCSGMHGVALVFRDLAASRFWLAMN